MGTFMEETSREIRCITWVGLIINVLLSVVKFVAGVLGRSQAVIADSIHSLSDVVTDIAILVGAKHWTSPPDKHHPYGHGRIETIITVFIGISLGGVALRIAYEALGTIKTAHAQPPEMIALFGAIVSIISKEALYHWTVYRARRIKSNAVIANAWHHRSDAFSSIPVAVAVGVTRIRPDWAVVDHIGAVVVAVFILHAAWNIMKDALYELVDSSASQEIIKEIQSITEKHREVQQVHAIRARKVGPGLHVDMHLLVEGTLTVFMGHQISEEVKEHLLNSSLNVLDVVVHIEPYPEAKR